MNVTKIILWSTLTVCWKGTESWEENGQKHCCLLTSFAIWPLAFSLLSHAHCLFCPQLPSKWELISMLRSPVAIKLYLHRDRRGAFWQIICSRGDCRAVLRLICFLKTKLEIQILCCSHCVSMPPLTLPPSLLSLSTCRFIFNAFLGGGWAQHPPALPFWSLLSSSLVSRI